MWIDSLARSRIKFNFRKGVFCPVEKLKPVDATYPETIFRVFVKTSHIIIFQCGGVRRVIFVNRKFYSIVFVQSVFGGYPYVVAFVLVQIINETVGNIFIG